MKPRLIWAAACLLAAAALPATAASTASDDIVPDEAGALALRAAAPPARKTFLDDLSGEQVALASTVVLQARIEGADPGGDRLDARVVNVLLGGQQPALRTAATVGIFNKTGYALGVASTPVLSLYRNDRVDAYATLITTAVGYSAGDALIYRRRTGAVDVYSLRSSDNLFGCVVMGRTPRERCRAKQLSRYGVQSPVQLQLFEKLSRTDTWTAALWMVVRDRDPRAQFPTAECTSRDGTNCASFAAFLKRAHIVIPM